MKIAGRISKHKTVPLSIFIMIVMLIGVVAVHRSASQTSTSTPITFKNYELAGNPFNRRTTIPFSVGTTCPNMVSSTDARSCENTEGEPQIRADRAGNFYGSSENVFCVIGGQCGGTFAWKSADGGNTFKTLKLPNSVSTGRLPPNCVDFCQALGFSPAGGDTDIAVAPQKNTFGFYNVYVASLATAPPLANVFVSTSTNGGDDWSIPPTPAASIPVDDREWIAADGSNRVCISYHSIITTNEIVVDCSDFAGAVFNRHALAFDTAHQFHAAFNNQIGNLAIDPSNHVIYQVFSSIADKSELDPASSNFCGLSCGTHAVWIARSIDAGATFTFTDFLVYSNPNRFLNYGHQFVNVSVDRAGNVYVVYSDDHNLWYSFSTTFGRTWNGPFQINQLPSNTAIMPWSSAGTAGGLDVVWYGSSTDSTPNMPPDKFLNDATWYVYFSQNLAAATPNSPWNQVQASGIIHHGAVCEGGVSCTGNRDLLDDFGVAASPTTGLAVIIYTSDQFFPSALEPPTTRDSGSRVCTTNDTIDCEHTNIAVQIGGSTINQPPGEFEVDDEDFEETNVNNNGGQSPHFEMDLTNRGTVSINKLDIGIRGLPWAVTWSSTSPIQPGQSVKATSTSVPAGLLLLVGDIYTVTITATLADGRTETQTTNAIYTLGAGLGL